MERLVLHLTAAVRQPTVAGILWEALQVAEITAAWGAEETGLTAAEAMEMAGEVMGFEDGGEAGGGEETRGGGDAGATGGGGRVTIGGGEEGIKGGGNTICGGGDATSGGGKGTLGGGLRRGDGGDLGRKGFVGEVR
ncbi:PREDICTED: glycine-rich cell wall structural protein 1.0-like [Erythranthe guttata]|uniref:glycine-rich cell wall structural protein 1.0-like n=1 Tax=Erythranthe guttata TaxID=4155 RepID=UPI00064DB2B7|nr:PREDICTED: glycine-rich cell wall structural protein 1.0-like [Erythranthe guttata]|eukprot:XP_012856153.1 PREDICTED: glycine-rich cell wall structural protein 1.0-like [Erythranthe guttata]